jgi:hypothetical protein
MAINDLTSAIIGAAIERLVDGVHRIANGYGSEASRS